MKMEPSENLSTLRQKLSISFFLVVVENMFKYMHNHIKLCVCFVPNATTENGVICMPGLQEAL